jgi:hypothetical protein
MGFRGGGERRHLGDPERDPVVECPKTGHQIQLLPKPAKGLNIRIVAAPIDCPVCGDTHVVSYPPPRIK